MPQDRPPNRLGRHGEDALVAIEQDGERPRSRRTGGMADHAAQALAKAPGRIGED
jgi:hypothetical protein